MSGAAISARAERLLARLLEQPQAASQAPARDLAALMAADLAARRPDGTVEASAAGRAFLLRRQNARQGGPLDPFRAQHLDLAIGTVAAPGGAMPVLIDAAESPLAWLARRKGRDGQMLIAPAQLQAGERLRADFTAARQLPRMAADWERPRHRGGAADLHVTERQIAARQRLQQALRAAGPEFAGLLLDVCCYLKRLDDVERERRWPKRSAKIVLQLGLARLARHYGYDEMARGPRHAGMRHWTAGQAAL